MAHRTSSAASHAAQMLLRHYTITMRPAHEMPHGTPSKITASEEHLGIMIDLASNAWEVALLRPELRYWQTQMKYGDDSARMAEQIRYYVKRAREVLERVPQYANEDLAESIASMVPSPGKWGRQLGPKELPSLRVDIPARQAKRLKISRSGMEAAKSVMNHYAFAPRDPNAPTDPHIMGVRIAMVIDVCLGLTKAVKAIPLLRGCELGLAAGTTSPDEARAVLREVGVIFEALPNFRDRRDEVKLLLPA